jgi:DNA-binding NtrC family response regulator/ligand-binding sensor domain-containing protein
MATLARLSFWVPTPRMEDFREEHDRLLTPLLREIGLEMSIPSDRPSVDGVCSRLYAVPDPGAVTTKAQDLSRDAAWQATLQRLEPAFATAPDCRLHWRLELYRTSAGSGHTQAAKGIHVEAGSGNRSGIWYALDLADGLPSSTIAAICQDRQGALWFGTLGGGVSRFDGQAFSTFTTDDGLGHNAVTAILEDRRGHLWFGTGHGSRGGGGVSRYDGEAITTFTTDDGLAGNTVRSILEDRFGRLWFGTWGGGVSCWDDERFEGFTTADGLLHNSVPSALEDRQGQLWFGTRGGGVSRWDGQIFANLATTDREIWELLEDRQGNLWFGGWGGTGLSRWDGQTVEPVVIEHGLPSRSVHAMAEDSQGHLWFGFWGGEEHPVCRYDGRTFDALVAADGRTPGEVSTIFEDRQEHLWFGTRTSGVCRYSGQHLQTFSTQDGLKSNWVWSLLEDRKGAMWFGTYGGGVTRWDGQTCTTFTTDDGLGHNEVRVLFEDRVGNLWFGTQGGGVSRWDGDGFTTFTTDDGLGHNRLWAILEDRVGRLWFGTEGGGVSRWDGQAFTTFTTDDGLASNNVRALIEDQHGAIWLGHESAGLDSGGGLSRWDGHTFTCYTTADGLPYDQVRSLFTDRQGHLWSGTGDWIYGKGLSRYDGNAFTTFAGIDELSHHTVACMLEDDQGHQWFGSQGGGVIRCDGQVLQTLRKRDGLANDMVYDLLQDHRGDIWIATHCGVTRYRNQPLPPRIQLTAVVADRRYEPRGTIALNSSHPLLGFEFRGQCFKTHRDQLVYIYRLRGYEEEWRTTRQRRVEFSALPLGEYAFEVKVVDRDLNHSETAEVRVCIEPDALVESLTTALGQSGPRGEFVGRSAALRRVQQQLRQFAPAALTGLILGETGTGKGLAARTLHRLSPRCRAPFVLFSCGGQPDSLIESELFGHEKGAFTGAASRRLGKVEMARGGTLFLDEIGDLPLAAQVKLLRLLEERTFERVGGTRVLSAEVRVVAATNRDLQQMVAEGAFRQDLYFRLVGFVIHLPPLHQRRGDIPLLALSFLGPMAAHLDKPVSGLSNAAEAMLMAYDWPGNVRELQHAMERAVVVCRGQTIEVEDLSLDRGPPGEPTLAQHVTLEEHERRYIHAVLQDTGGRIAGPQGAAAILGLPESSLRYRMKKLGIQRP